MGKVRHNGAKVRHFDRDLVKGIVGEAFDEAIKVNVVEVFYEDMVCKRDSIVLHEKEMP